MTTDTDVLIVGAGPAGSALASLLAQRGIETVIVDRARFPRVKPCGETLNPGVLRLLGELGLLEKVAAKKPAWIDGWQFANGTGLDAIGMYVDGNHGFGMPRRDFDSVLLCEARNRGVRVLEGTHVTDIVRRRPSGFVVNCREDGDRLRTIRAQYVIGADGLRSIVSRRLGMVGRHSRLRKFSITCRLRGVAPNSVGQLHMINGYTVGLAPVHETEPLWNGTVVLSSRGWCRRTMGVKQVYESCLSRVTESWVEKPNIIGGPWTSGPFDRPVQAVAARDVLLIGDAAGYFDPLTGQGVFQALRTAQLAADAIESVYSRGGVQSRAFANYARHVRRLQRWTRVFQRSVDTVLSRERSRRIALHQLSKRTAYMDRLVQFAGDDLSIGGLARLDLLVRARRTA